MATDRATDRKAVPRRRFLTGCGAGLFSLAALPQALAADGRGAPPPVPERPERTVRAGAMTLALTFDDGPSPLYTPKVLAILARHGVQATFFMLGANVAKYPDTVRQVADAGHVLANHSWSHPNLETLRRAQVRDQIRRTQDVIERTTGRRPVLFRAPGGHFADAAMAECATLGLRPISWSVDPEDWSNPGSRRIADRVLADARTGSIVLNHDGTLSGSDVPEHEGLADRTQTVEALGVYLPRLKAAGY
ncbi:polysaccharide deacetylase family protein, partial [Streptomyces sp. NPDC057654]|uniref:polysaccharide deacetylase family protein n=1 Tax=Streptomyces sp. NPDC057654 TaxID=3346196 RepID=UPI0036CDE90D